jgi:hypothetical protein
VTVKLALVAPAGTVTLAGTLAAALPLVSATAAPPPGAAPLSVTVPCAVAPPLTEVGLSASPLTTGPVVPGAGAKTVRVALDVTPAYVAEIVTGVRVVTEVLVVAVKVALVAPAGIVTLAGTVATEGLPLFRVTLAPPAGAAALRLTVPCDICPPFTAPGLKVIPVSVGVALPAVPMFRTLLLVRPPLLAVIVTEVGAVVDDVQMVKSALVAPAGTAMPKGMLEMAAALLLVRSTIIWGNDAGALRVTVPTEGSPGFSLAGLNVRPTSTG